MMENGSITFKFSPSHRDNFCDDYAYLVYLVVFGQRFFFNLEKLNIMTGKEIWACSISIPLSEQGVVYSVSIRTSPSTMVRLCTPLIMPFQYHLEEN